MRDGDIGHPTPQQPADGHGTGNGIRVGIDDNQDMVIAQKLIIETAQFFRDWNCHKSEFPILCQWSYAEFNSITIYF